MWVRLTIHDRAIAATANREAVLACRRDAMMHKVGNGHEGFVSRPSYATLVGRQDLNAASWTAML
jgi:hypothetical protein